MKDQRQTTETHTTKGTNTEQNKQPQKGAACIPKSGFRAGLQKKQRGLLNGEEHHRSCLYNDGQE